MTDFILSSGQSNHVGQGDPGGGDWAISPLVKVWNNENNRDDLLNPGTTLTAPNRLANPFVANNNAMDVQMASLMTNWTNAKAYLLRSGRAGHSIDQWHNGTVTGPQYARWLSIFGTWASIQLPFDVFIWNHGTADNATASTYASRFGALLTSMTSDGLIDAATAIILNETGPGTPAINAVLEAIAAADPRIGYARVGSLPTVDGVHFSGDSHVRAGHIQLSALMTTETKYLRT